VAAGQKIKLLFKNFVSDFNKHLLSLCESSEGFPIGLNVLNHSFALAEVARKHNLSERGGHAV